MHAAVGQLTRQPQVRFGPFEGPATTIATMRDNVRGERGERSQLLRSVTEDVVRGLQPKDYLSEILALRHFVATRCRYLNDPLTTEWVKDPQRLAEEILASGSAAADCDEIASLIVAMARQCGREGEFITVGFGRPGSYVHVFARIKEPKSGKWIVCDPVAGVDEAGMLHRVTTWKAWQVD